jgi:hypothetical protein
MAAGWSNILLVSIYMVHFPILYKKRLFLPYKREYWYDYQFVTYNLLNANKQCIPLDFYVFFTLKLNSVKSALPALRVKR